MPTLNIVKYLGSGTHHFIKTKIFNIQYAILKPYQLITYNMQISNFTERFALCQILVLHLCNISIL